MKYFTTLLLFLSVATNAQIKILFDASKAESAGNADWVIDADAHNLGFFNGPALVGSGSESNAQKIPSPVQSGITAQTSETYWNGALSNWAIDCAKQGFVVESLPYNGQITYGSLSNPQDLSHYKVFVIDEPNILFTAAEKNAIVNFVAHGGGLCMISDHTISDRNNDGVDSPQIFNDLMGNNDVLSDPFGIFFDYADFSQTSSNIVNLPQNPILHGTAGNVSQVQWSGGTTMTLNAAANSSVAGLIYKSGSAASGTTNVMCASAIYLDGKVAAFGDSSIADDGTGDNNDVLYNGYTGDANGNHQKLLMNAIIWLTTPNPLSVENVSRETPGFTIAPNPIQNHRLAIHIENYKSEALKLDIYDSVGRLVKTDKIAQPGVSDYVVDAEFAKGLYVCKISGVKFLEAHFFEVK